MSDKAESPAEGGAPINWYRVPIAREKLRELTERSKAKGFLQTVPYLCLLAFTGAAAFWAYHHLPLPWLFVILFIHRTFYAFLLNGFHELVHGTVFKTRRLNAIIARVSNAMAEAKNAWIQRTKNMAYGYRNRERFRMAILFHLGGLNLMPETLSNFAT